MQSRGGAAIIGPVLVRRLIVEIEEGPLPRGRVLHEAGNEYAFTGWVELAAAIESARRAESADAAADQAQAPLRPTRAEG
jgi:hypothetical protein